MKYFEELLYVIAKLLLGIGLLLFAILFSVLGGWGVYVGLLFGIVGFLMMLFTFLMRRTVIKKAK